MHACVRRPRPRPGGALLALTGPLLAVAMMDMGTAPSTSSKPWGLGRPAL
jgi:hypothetical protein